jgi:uncharacterized protein
MILTLYLTLDCNQRCRYCYAAPHRKAGMTEDEGRRGVELALDEMVRQGGDHLGMRYFGGEPLLRWDLIPPLVAFADQAGAARGVGVSHALSTNGLLLEPHHIVFFLDHQVAIGISIDGPEHVHNRNRRYPDGRGSFAEAIQKARMAVEADLCVELVLVADPTNAAELAASVRYLHEATGAWLFTVSFNIHAPWSDAELDQLERSYHELGDYYVARFWAGHPIQLDFLNNKMNVLLRGGFIPEYLCQIGKTDLAVTPEGLIYPCLRLAAMDPEGRTAVGSLEQGLDAGRIQALRAACDGRFNQREREECRACLHAESCLSWCAAANLAMTGHPAHVGEIMCRHERISMAVAHDVLTRIDLTRYRELYQEYFRKAPPAPLTPAAPHGESRVLPVLLH